MNTIPLVPPQKSQSEERWQYMCDMVAELSNRVMILESAYSHLYNKFVIATDDATAKRVAQNLANIIKGEA